MMWCKTDYTMLHVHLFFCAEPTLIPEFDKKEIKEMQHFSVIESTTQGSFSNPPKTTFALLQARKSWLGNVWNDTLIFFKSLVLVGSGGKQLPACWRLRALHWASFGWHDTHHPVMHGRSSWAICYSLFPSLCLPSGRAKSPKIH